MKLFERKFGKDFLKKVPNGPGVYRFEADEGKLVYVGKAKNLRRRLSQYRRARGGKMRKIVKTAQSLTWSNCPSELDACLLELSHIQKERPKLNISGAFSYRYPLIGVLPNDKECRFVFTTTPEVFPEYSFYGAFRSREVTAEGFFSLIRLLQFIGHPSKLREERKAYSYEFGLRRLPALWPAQIVSLLRGASADFLENLVIKLLENAGARAKAAEIQEGIDALKRFWELECVPLAKAISTVDYEIYPVAQTERDPLFVRAGFRRDEWT